MRPDIRVSVSDIVDYYCAIVKRIDDGILCLRFLSGSVKRIFHQIDLIEVKTPGKMMVGDILRIISVYPFSSTSRWPEFVICYESDQVFPGVIFRVDLVLLHFIYYHLHVLWSF